MDINEKRNQKKGDSQMVPQPVKGDSGLVQVDTTWGKIQPIKVADGVRTIDEIELNDSLGKGMQVIDGRTPDFYKESTIPGAKNIPHNEVVERMDELNPDEPAIFFCNGLQCPQSSWAIHNLLKAGYPPDKILYYRGGMHDWVTLGLSVEKGE
jgi:rhodanese-related sulfurtransferase